MAMPTEELLQQYFDDRLALIRMDFLRQMGDSVDTNLTVHELRVVLLIASGVASSRERLGTLLNVSRDSLSATLSNLVQQGYLVVREAGSGGIVPTDEAMDIFDVVADRQQITMELLANLDPDDLAALVQGTHALRAAMELYPVSSGDRSLPPVALASVVQ